MNAAFCSVSLLCSCVCCPLPACLSLHTCPASASLARPRSYQLLSCSFVSSVHSPHLCFSASLHLRLVPSFSLCISVPSLVQSLLSSLLCLPVLFSFLLPMLTVEIKFLHWSACPASPAFESTFFNLSLTNTTYMNLDVSGFFYSDPHQIVLSQTNQPPVNSLFFSPRSMHHSLTNQWKCWETQYLNVKESENNFPEAAFQDGNMNIGKDKKTMNEYRDQTG